MQVSTIVPARDSERTIGECVTALRRQVVEDVDIEVIVVDDGSRDDTARVARDAGATVISIDPSGPAVARNRGVAASHGEIVLFTDADCVPADDWVENMVSPFVDSSVSGTKGVYTTAQHELTARFVQIEYESRYERMRPRQSIDFIDTYAAGFRRSLFDAIGGFDESFPHPSVEDQEFSFRYARQPGRMVFVPTAVVRHRHASSPWRYARKKFKIGVWKVRVMLRHPDKLVSDSHTPQGLKVEMLAALGALGAAPFGWTAPGAIALVVCAACFLVAASPLVVQAIRKDPVVGLCAIGFQAIRGVALGLGSLAGLARAFGGAASEDARPPGPRQGQEEREKCHELV